MQTGIYKHYKGSFCQVLGVARHSETNDPVVVYVTLSPPKQAGPSLIVRPLANFNAKVQVGCDGGLDHVCGPGCDREVPRFEYVGDELPR